MVTPPTLDILPQLLTNGVLVGGIYALVAVGLTLIYGVLGVVNFAHGEFYMAAAYAAFVLVERIGALNPYAYFLAVFGAIGILVAISLPLERGVIRPVLTKSFETAVIATFAVSTVLINLAQLIFDPTPRLVRGGLAGAGEAYGIFVSWQRLAVLLVALALFIALHSFLQRTKTGKAIRAVSQNREGASIVGIDIGRVSLVTFSIAIALAATAGALVSPLFSVYPTAGQALVLKAFAVVIVGGLGDARGAMIASIILGVGESLLGGLVSGTFKDALGFVLMILVLSAKPDGLFGRAIRPL